MKTLEVQIVTQTESAVADSVQRPCSTSTQQETYNRLREVGWWPVTGAVILERNGEYAIVHADGHVTVAA